MFWCSKLEKSSLRRGNHLNLSQQYSVAEYIDMLVKTNSQGLVHDSTGCSIEIESVQKIIEIMAAK